MDMKLVYIILTAFFTSICYYIASLLLNRKQAGDRLFTLLASIKTELLTLKDREQELVGNIIEEAKKDSDYPLKKVPLIGLIKPSFEYFTVYDNSSHELIGLLRNKSKTLAPDIAKTYLLVKGYYDEIIYFPELDKMRTDPSDYMKNHEVCPDGKITYIKNDSALINYFNNFILRDRKAILKTIDNIVSEINIILGS